LAQSAFNDKDRTRLVFPLWDPSIDRALIPSVQDLEQVVLGTQQLTLLAEQLRKLAERLIEHEQR
jgi:hypothetical protein